MADLFGLSQLLTLLQTFTGCYSAICQPYTKTKRPITLPYTHSVSRSLLIPVQSKSGTMFYWASVLEQKVWWGYGFFNNLLHPLFHGDVGRGKATKYQWVKLQTSIVQEIEFGTITTDSETQTKFQNNFTGVFLEKCSVVKFLVTNCITFLVVTT